MSKTLIVIFSIYIAPYAMFSFPGKVSKVNEMSSIDGAEKTAKGNNLKDALSIAIKLKLLLKILHYTYKII